MTHVGISLTTCVVGQHAEHDELMVVEDCEVLFFCMTAPLC